MIKHEFLHFFYTDEGEAINMEDMYGLIPSQKTLQSLSILLQKLSNFPQEAIDQINRERTQGQQVKEFKKDKRIVSRGYVYIIESQGYHKIGKTRDPRYRTKQYTTENPPSIEMSLIYTFDVTSCEEVEKYLHKRFSNKRVRGEWFKLTQEDLLLVPKMIKKFLI